MRFPLKQFSQSLKSISKYRLCSWDIQYTKHNKFSWKICIITHGHIIATSQDKRCNTKTFISGNPIIPILISMATQSTVGATNVLYNASELFYNIYVPTNILSQGYIDIIGMP